MDITGTGSIHVEIDATAIEHLRRALDRVPDKIKTMVIARAMRRVRDTTESRVAKRSAERLDIPQKLVRERIKRTTGFFNAGGNTQGWIVRSGWIHLYRLGARQTRKGVTVRLRGSYAHAFIAKMRSGHRGVFRRTGASRFPIRELFGPNPASDMVNHSQVYLLVLADVLDEIYAPRVLHELERILPPSSL